MTRVAGLDLSLTSTGLTLDNGEGHEVLRIKPKLKIDPFRMEWIMTEIIRELRRCETDLVLVEDFAFSAKGKAVYQMGGLGWIVRLALLSAGFPYVVVTPTQLKKYATGKGNASKDLVLSSMTARTGIIFESNDESDSMALYSMARESVGLSSPMGDLPKDQRDVIDGLGKPVGAL